MERYLIDEYNVIEDKDLTSENDIKGYFFDCGHEYFDCGQGYFQDEATVLIKIDNKFFKVDIEAEVWGDKQDHGDKLYYVEHITNVKYSEIDKPEPKSKTSLNYYLTLTDAQINYLEDWLTKEHISYASSRGIKDL